MGTPQSLDDFDLSVIIPSAPLPRWLYIEVEGTAEQLPQRMARMLRLYGFEVRIVQEEEQHGQI